MKTNPIGVRFDIDILEKLKVLGITSPQKALNFLSEFWVDNQNKKLPEVVQNKTKENIVHTNKQPVVAAPIFKRTEKPKPKTVDKYQVIYDNCTNDRQLWSLWKQIEADVEMPQENKDVWWLNFDHIQNKSESPTLVPLPKNNSPQRLSGMADNWIVSFNLLKDTRMIPSLTKQVREKAMFSPYEKEVLLGKLEEIEYNLTH